MCPKYKGRRLGPIWLKDIVKICFDPFLLYKPFRISAYWMKIRTLMDDGRASVFITVFSKTSY